MPLTSQQGDVADRLRNFFRITGRIPSSVDEVVVPTANIQDLDQPPFRSKVVNFGGNAGRAATPLNSTHAGIILRRPGVAVVKRVWIRNQTAGVQSYTLALRSNAEIEVLSSSPGSCVNLESPWDPVNFGALRVPVERFTYDTVGADPGVVTITAFTVPATTTLLVPLDGIVLRANVGKNLLGQPTSISSGLFVTGAVVNQGVEMNAEGTYYAELG